jgi:hypothetical protein
MNRQQFLEYASYFNTKQWDKVTSYFRPDVTLEYPDNFTGTPIAGRTLHGPKEFIANYEALTANVREVLNIGAFFPGNKQFCVELVTEFHLLGDTKPGAPGLPGKKGDVRVMNQNVIYDLDEKGKFKRIRIFHHRHLDPKTVKLH